MQPFLNSYDSLSLNVSAGSLTVKQSSSGAFHWGGASAKIIGLVAKKKTQKNFHVFCIFHAKYLFSDLRQSK